MPHRGVWNAAALGTTPEVILCEALIDALTFWCAGYRNVTASYGIEGFTADHLAAFKEHGVQRVLIAYDRDEAGERAAEKLAQQLESLKAWMRTGSSSPKEWMRTSTHSRSRRLQKSLGVAIRSAQWLGKGQAKPITTTAAAVLEQVEDVHVEPSASAEAPPLVAESVLDAVTEEAAKEDMPCAAPLPAA